MTMVSDSTAMQKR